MLGAALLVASPALAIYTWLPYNKPNGGSPELPDPIAILIVGVIALISLTATFYLAFEEWTEVKHRRAKSLRQ